MWYTIDVIRVVIQKEKIKMKNFKIYCVSNEDSSKYEISLMELITKGNYTEEEVGKLLDYIETTKYKTFRWKLVHKDSIHAMDGDGIQHYLVDLK
jgi:hypothetical protein